MTATTRPPRRARHSSWMDSLGFTDTRNTWSDTVYVDVDAMHLRLDHGDTPRPPAALPEKRGRHERIPEEPDPFQDWAPQPMVRRLERGNTRWTVLLGSLLLLASVSAAVYWFGFEEPRAAQRQAVQATLVAAEDLNTHLVAVPATPDGPGWEAVRIGALETAARQLFETAGDLPGEQSEMRAASIAASNAALESVRLINEAEGYRNATDVVLSPPALETDPDLIALDEAARSFGEWQARFESGLSVLSSREFVDVDRRLDTLSARLPVALQNYVDALREDDMTGAQAVVDAIATELTEIRLQMETSLGSLRARTSELAAEARIALEPLLD